MDLREIYTDGEGGFDGLELVVNIIGYCIKGIKNGAYYTVRGVFDTPRYIGRGFRAIGGGLKSIGERLA